MTTSTDATGNQRLTLSLIGIGCGDPAHLTRKAVDAINARDRPLALYPFVRDAATRRFLIANTRSGGVSVNDAILHVVQHDLPFGGVGASGMGHYHGRDGFLAFSKLRPVFYQAPMSGMRALWPPFGALADRVLDFLTR